MSEHVLTIIQKTFLNHGEAFIVSKNLVFTGELQIPAMKASLNKMIEKHEILRTSFPKRGDARVQQINPPAVADLEVVDFSGLSDGDRKEAISKHVTGIADRSFNPETGPMWKTTLYKVGTQEYILNVVFSHANFDGWSMSVFTRELLDGYCSVVTGKPPLAPPLAVQYRDYSERFYSVYTRELLDSRAAYWQEKLGPSNDAPLPKFVHDFKPSKWKLQSDLLQELRTLALREGVSLYVVLSAFFGILTALASGRRDQILSCIVSVERNRAELDGLIGPFNGVIPMPLTLSDDPTVRTAIDRVRLAVLNAGDNYFPLGSMDGRKLPRPTICLNLLSSAPPPTTVQLPGVQAPLHLPAALYETTDLAPLKLVVNRYYEGDNRSHSRMGSLKFNVRMIEKKHELSGITWYNAEHFEEADVNNLMANFLRILENGIFAVSGKVSDLAVGLDLDPTRYAGKL